MKILVTGGAGFIGTNFIRYWLCKHPESEITVWITHYAGRRENLEDIQGVFLHSGDICDRAWYQGR